MAYKVKFRDQLSAGYNSHGQTFVTPEPETIQADGADLKDGWFRFTANGYVEKFIPADLIASVEAVSI